VVVHQEYAFVAFAAVVRLFGFEAFAFRALVIFGVNFEVADVARVFSGFVVAPKDQDVEGDTNPKVEEALI
jgi:hypothetical protein